MGQRRLQGGGILTKLSKILTKPGQARAAGGGVDGCQGQGLQEDSEGPDQSLVKERVFVTHLLAKPDLSLM